MRTLSRSCGLISLLLALAGSPSLASEGHCHNVEPGGKLADAEDLPTKDGCIAEGGVWFVNAQHCHLVAPGGKVTELPTVRSQNACTLQGGLWTTHTPTKQVP